MTVEEIIENEFALLKNELIAKYDEKGMRASSEWANSLEEEYSFSLEKLNAKILGLEYSEQLESGRLPGKQPPIAAIEKWIHDKGIAARIEGEITVSSLAFLIARKIGREGWKREQYGGVELISEVVTPERIQRIIDKVGDGFASVFTADLISEMV